MEKENRKDELNKAWDEFYSKDKLAATCIKLSATLLKCVSPENRALVKDVEEDIRKMDIEDIFNLFLGSIKDDDEDEIYLVRMTSLKLLLEKLVMLHVEPGSEIDPKLLEYWISNN